MNIKKVRKKLGITQEKLAERINNIPIVSLGISRIGEIRNVTSNHVSKWESGDRHPNYLIKETLKFLLESNDK